MVLWFYLLFFREGEGGILCVILVEGGGANMTPL